MPWILTLVLPFPSYTELPRKFPAEGKGEGGATLLLGQICTH